MTESLRLSKTIEETPMSKKVIKNWLALAEYDFETAKAMRRVV